MTAIAALDVGDADLARDLLEVQRAAYRVEADLIGFDGIPQLHETLDGLRAAPERWLGLRDGDGLAAAVAYLRLPDATLDICRLVVAPRAHRRGYATALLDALDRLEPAERTVVSTGTANVPALALYARRDFVPVGTRAIAPGVTVTLLERRAGDVRMRMTRLAQEAGEEGLGQGGRSTPVDAERRDPNPGPCSARTLRCGSAAAASGSDRGSSPGTPTCG